MLKEILYWFVICRLVEVYAGNLYFRKSQCNLSYEFVYENTSCYAKSYSRNISTFNYNIVFKKPLKNLWMEGKVFFRYGNIDREVLTMKKLDWCAFLNGSIDSVYFKYMASELTRNGLAHMVHKCPIKEFNVYNGTIDIGWFLSQFSSGYYKFMFRFWEKEKYIGDITCLTTLTTRHKESFG